MKFSVDFNTSSGKVKPLHAINNAPISGTSNALFHFLKEANIPYSRLHDTGGRFGGAVFVDIANIFRDMSADPEQAESYDFAFTDWLLSELMAQGAEPFFRLGPTIENSHRIKAYNIFPPEDNYKWAQICEGIIKHYNHGWANGFEFGIKYWEIWNEPDNEPEISDNPMWKGTMEQYFALYEVTANHLKSKFPYIKIGGYASCGFYALTGGFASQANSSSRTDYFIDFFQAFLKHISSKEHSAPLDFFSWHSYSKADNNCIYADYVREQLDSFGFAETESILNEWNPGVGRRGTEEDACFISEMILKLHRKPLDMLMYYDGQIHGAYMGLFNPLTFDIFPAYYALHSFGELYAMESEVKSETDGIPMLAAKSGNKGKILAVNNTPEDCDVTLQIPNGWRVTDYRVLDGINGLTSRELDFKGSIMIPGKKIVLIECEK